MEAQGILQEPHAGGNLDDFDSAKDLIGGNIDRDLPYSFVHCKQTGRPRLFQVFWDDLGGFKVRFYLLEITDRNHFLWRQAGRFPDFVDVLRAEWGRQEKTALRDFQGEGKPYDKVTFRQGAIVIDDRAAARSVSRDPAFLPFHADPFVYALNAKHFLPSPPRDQPVQARQRQDQPQPQRQRGKPEPVQQSKNTSRGGPPAREEAPVRNLVKDRFDLLNRFTDEHLRTLNPAAGLVWFVHWRHATRDGARSRISIGRVAESTGLDRRTVTRALKELTERGFIRQVAKGGPREGTATYELLLPSTNSPGQDQPETPS